MSDEMKTVRILANTARTGAVGAVRVLERAIAERWIADGLAEALAPEDVEKAKRAAKRQAKRPVAASPLVSDGTENESQEVDDGEHQGNDSGGG